MNRNILIDVTMSLRRFGWTCGLIVAVGEQSVADYVNRE